MFFMQEDSKINYGRFQLNHVVLDKVKNNLQRIKRMNASITGGIPQESQITNEKMN